MIRRFLHGIAAWAGYRWNRAAYMAGYAEGYGQGHFDGWAEHANREDRDNILFGFDDLDGERACRVCGCTQNNACVDEHGPCWWVDGDLCSACVGKEEAPSVGCADTSPAAACGLAREEGVGAHYAADYVASQLQDGVTP